MYPLQGPTGENESSSSEPHKQGKELVLRTLIGAVITYGLIASITTLLFDRDLFRLQGLNLSIKVFQTIARQSGSLALIAEQRYNDYVETLH
jgi:hypothetical protein